jgi:hypothetical protein
MVKRKYLMATDRELIEKVQREERVVYEQLFQKHYAHILLYASHE